MIFRGNSCRISGVASGQMKMSQVVRDKASVGEISGVYTPVHEHFEPTLNAVSCRMGHFQRLLVGFVPVGARTGINPEWHRQVGCGAHPGNDPGPHLVD